MTTESQGTQPQPRVFTNEELSTLVPGLGTIMPDIGVRTAKLYYAARAGNWPLASFQLNEVRGLMVRGAFTRPRYSDDLKAFIDESITKLRLAIQSRDFGAFESAFGEAIESANSYHVSTNHGFLQWKLPATAPDDLDYTPRS